MKSIKEESVFDGLLVHNVKIDCEYCYNKGICEKDMDICPAEAFIKKSDAVARVSEAVAELRKEFTILACCDELNINGQMKCPWTPEGCAIMSACEKIVEKHLGKLPSKDEVLSCEKPSAEEVGKPTNSLGEKSSVVGSQNREKTRNPLDFPHGEKDLFEEEKDLWEEKQLKEKKPSLVKEE